MRIKSIPIAQVEHGMKAARVLRNPSGQILIQEGVELTESLLHSLERRNITRVYVQVEELRSDEELAAERASMEARLKVLFRNVAHGSTLELLYQTILEHRLRKLT